MKTYNTKPIITAILICGFIVAALLPGINRWPSFYNIINIAEGENLTDSDGDGVPEFDGRSRIRVA